MTFTFDRRYDERWEELRKNELRCHGCMYDAPYEYCCKNYCGRRDYCEGCTAGCRNDLPLCASLKKDETIM